MRLPWSHKPLPAWVAPAALYAVALAARLAMLAARPYGDEAHHYFVAREFGQMPDNIVGGEDLGWLFWWRPLFSLLLSPGAQVSFTGFRVGYMAMTAALAPLLWWWLRARGVGQGASVAAGLVAAVHPTFLLWGVRAFPDELMATLYVAGMALWDRARPVGGAALMLAAAWTKESALVGVAVLLAEELWLAVQRGPGWTLNVRLAPRHALLAVVLLLSYVPHLYANSIGAPDPGWSRGANPRFVIEGAFTTVWLIPLVAASLAVPAARRLALQAGAYMGFYFWYTTTGGKAEGWYYVLPGILAWGAVCALCGELASRRPAAPGSGPSAAPLPGPLPGLAAKLPDQAKRAAAPIAIALAILLAATQALVPSTQAAKGHYLHPVAEIREHSALEMYRFEMRRDQDLWTLIDHAQERDWEGVLLVDVGWFFALWPFSDRAGSVGASFTGIHQGNTTPWADTIEGPASMTVVMLADTPLNLAIRQTYDDCVGFRTHEYWLIRGRDCPGRAATLQAAFDHHAAAA